MSIESNLSIALTTEIETFIKNAGLTDAGACCRFFAGIDQLHAGGLAATEKLLRHFTAGEAVKLLDIGCGLGGTLRNIALHHSGKFYGIDINSEYILTGSFINKSFNQFKNIRLFVQNARQLNFAVNTFDWVLIQHVLNNLPEKADFFRNCARILVPGGKLLLHEIFINSAEKIKYPVPWAQTSADTFSEPIKKISNDLEQNGFNLVYKENRAVFSENWYLKALQNIGKIKPKKFSPFKILGEDFERMLENMVYNLESKNIEIYELVYELS